MTPHTLRGHRHPQEFMNGGTLKLMVLEQMVAHQKVSGALVATV